MSDPLFLHKLMLYRDRLNERLGFSPDYPQPIRDRRDRSWLLALPTDGTPVYLAYGDSPAYYDVDESFEASRGNWVRRTVKKPGFVINRMTVNNLDDGNRIIVIDLKTFPSGKYYEEVDGFFCFLWSKPSSTDELILVDPELQNKSGLDEDIFHLFWMKDFTNTKNKK